MIISKEFHTGAWRGTGSRLCQTILTGEKIGPMKILSQTTTAYSSSLGGYGYTRVFFCSIMNALLLKKIQTIYVASA
jgi:hypothetical protein